MGLQHEHRSLRFPTTELVCVHLDVCQHANVNICFTHIFELVLKILAGSFFFFKVQPCTTNMAKSRYSIAGVIPISSLTRINTTSGLLLSQRTHTAFEN